VPILELAMFISHTKFEAPSFVCSKDTTGVQKLKNRSHDLDYALFGTICHAWTGLSCQISANGGQLP